MPQILLFSVLAIEVKRKAPGAHTVLEIVLARWGTAAHLVFMFFAFCTNILVTRCFKGAMWLRDLLWLVVVWGSLTRASTVGGMAA
jgi:hypothetical protein